MGIMNVLTAVQDRFTRERGASMVEYALLLALIAMIALISVQTFGAGVSEKFSSIDSSVN
jgi:pilus assembly protein Flp/PilA